MFGQAMLGLVVSTTVMVCTPLVLLPQASTAVQVRQTVLVPAQLLLTTSLKLMVTALQPSEAVATPVALVVVGAGHSMVRLAGAVMVGGVVSRTVIVCTQLRRLPHASVAVQVREMTLAPPQVLLTESL